MSDDEKSMIAAIAAKLDMVFVLLEQIRQDGKACRVHCDKEMPKVHGRIDDHIRLDHGFNPVWLVAAAGLMAALIALLK